MRLPPSACCSLALLIVTTTAVAQSDRAAGTRPLAVKQTIVDMEIMLDESSDPVAPQEWGPVFEQAGVPVRFRQRILDDEVSVTERVKGSTRTVNVVGELDRSGVIRFPGGRSFGRSDGQALASWIGELQTYGAQGSPDGQPVWGLTEKQFKDLFAELSRPVVADVAGLDFQPAVKQMGLPTGYGFRLDAAARDKLLAEGGDHPLRHEISGLSRGTALAIILADYDLGFRPLRTPNGEIELVAEPLGSLKDPWPIGWPLDDDRPRDSTAPALFAQVEAGFEDVSLADVLSAIEQATGTRVVVDFERCVKKGIDPASLNVSLPKKKTAWILILRTVAAQARLTREIMLDEAGTAFVSVFPFEPKRPNGVPGR
ncbi:MAG: hypothetical protein JNG89_03880 [Planctomycetaceae bacterium]|nr:hypothetical protein [Planctomycetaceae bacterium]